MHSDTHGQSAPIFGLAHLLGIELMPRIRNWQDLHLYRPHREARYAHIDALFTATIDWELIAAHLPDMLRVALSIRAGRLLPSAIRTAFLLRYLGSVELRRAISAATNKSEHFNRYAQWVSFGGGGLVTAAARDEQRKMIKHNHLVANLFIFHTVVGMTKALDAIAGSACHDAITPEALAGLSPYQTEHVNRFGNCVLDLTTPSAPLPFDQPARARPPGPTAPQKPMCEDSARILAEGKHGGTGRT